MAMKGAAKNKATAAVAAAAATAAATATAVAAAARDFVLLEFCKFTCMGEARGHSSEIPSA